MDKKILRFIDPHLQAMLSVFFEGCAPWRKRATLDRLNKRRKRKLIEGFGSYLDLRLLIARGKRSRALARVEKARPLFWR
ncbi:hypothetical protein FRB95_012310 [Tulasnella sp. JGI-2019a]|nr:hypothetical protein FRB95_012310 [Tulasnella sp. JGI-2019a]